MFSMKSLKLNNKSDMAIIVCKFKDVSNYFFKNL